jgi:hypothetical protein
MATSFANKKKSSRKRDAAFNNTSKMNLRWIYYYFLNVAKLSLLSLSLSILQPGAPIATARSRLSPSSPSRC